MWLGWASVLWFTPARATSSGRSPENKRKKLNEKYVPVAMPNGSARSSLQCTGNYVYQIAHILIYDKQIGKVERILKGICISDISYNKRLPAAALLYPGNSKESRITWWTFMFNLW